MTCLTVTVVIIVGAGHGYPQQQSAMGSGAAWLVPAKVGQLALLDGTSAEVAAQVQVAPAGDAITVVQQGSTAYAIGRTAGTVRRVNGASKGFHEQCTMPPGDKFFEYWR